MKVHLIKNKILLLAAFSVFLTVSIYSFSLINLNINAPKPNNLAVDSLNFKNKIVLVNFWSSWSKASRADNKNIVRLFQKYKSNSKIVFVSISLDTDQNSWKNAIEEDGLIWTNHICDFKKYDSPFVKKYEVATLPYYLILNNNQINFKSTSFKEIETQVEKMLN